MKIQKSVYTVTVLHTEDDAPAGCVSLSDLAALTEDQWIGALSHTSIIDVPDDQVEDELLAMGNDGTFFDYLED